MNLDVQDYYELWFSEDVPKPIILSRKDIQCINEYSVFDGQWVEDWPVVDARPEAGQIPLISI